MECYEQFAYIYDELINGDIDYKKWSEVIIEIINKLEIPKGEYLDLACGTGNLTVELYEKFKHTWAVDLSYDMLTKAETKFKNFKNKPKFVCQNICNLNLNHKFNVITCCLDSLNYIVDKGELINFFKNVYNHLDYNGIFIFDMNSYNKLTNILGNNSFNYDDQDITYVWENYLEDDIVNMYLTFFVKESNNIYRRFDEEHRERAYKNEEIKEIIKNIGFKLVKEFDNYKIDKDIDENTERIVYVLTK